MSEGRRMSIVKGGRNVSSDRLRLSIVDFDGNEDDSHALKRGSSVWKSGLKAKLANTYRMSPNKKFQPHLIRKKGKELMSAAFGELAYDHDVCREVANKVCVDILAHIKEQGFDRYKYVVRVIVGAKNGQAVKIASRALWDHEKDNFITLDFENQNLFAVATIFALYFE